MPRSLAVGAVIGALVMSRRASKSGAAAGNLPKLVLHLYDHCPFCIRVKPPYGVPEGVNGTLKKWSPAARTAWSYLCRL